MADKLVQLKDKAGNHIFPIAKGLAELSVGTSNIKNQAVTSAKIADTAIATGKLADGAVTTGKLADNSVTSGKIADGAVTANDLASNAVTTAKITDGNVTTAKLADKSVTAAKIADKTVTAAKIADSTITSDKISWSSLINKIYPVGSIYVSVNNTNPSTFIGGTWSQFGAGRTLVGVNTSDTDFNTVQKTGGSKTHRHDTALGADSNAIFMRDISTQSHTGTYSGQTRSYYHQWEDHDTAGRYWYTYYSSSLQPYITVYFWRRTA